MHIVVPSFFILILGLIMTVFLSFSLLFNLGNLTTFRSVSSSGSTSHPTVTAITSATAVGDERFGMKGPSGDRNSYLWDGRPGKREVLLDVEHYPIAPSTFVLEQVHVYVRHAERTPVSSRLHNPATGIPEYWKMCTAGFESSISELVPYGPTRIEPSISRKSRHSAKSSSRLPSDSAPRHVAPSSAIKGEPIKMKVALERKDGTSFDGECMQGELTDTGRESAFKFGSALRKLYGDRLGFLIPADHQEDNVYFRSTNVPRTIESLQHILQGLYSQKPHFVPNIRVRNTKEESLLGYMESCPKLRSMSTENKRAAATEYNPKFSELEPKLRKYVGAPLRIDASPKVSGLLDTIRSAHAHGISVPPEFEEPEVEALLVRTSPYPENSGAVELSYQEEGIITEWFGGYKSPVYRRLAAGQLFGEFVRKMSRKADLGPRDPLKFLVYSTHDTTIAGICATLDVFDQRWPAFTAYVTFELFRAPASHSPYGRVDRGPFLGRFMSFLDSKTRHYVRMRSQNRTLRLPICREHGQHLPGHPEFCTLEAFINGLKKYIPDDWEKECLVTEEDGSRTISLLDADDHPGPSSSSIPVEPPV